MLSNGITMAQSPGDHNSRGLCLLQITTQKILSLGKLSRLVHSRRGGFVTCCGLRVLRALRVLGRWWFSWATAGGTTLRNSNSSNSSRRFSSTLTCSLAPAKEDDVLPCPHFYSAPSSRDAQHVTPPPLAPSGLTSATRGLSWNH